MTASKRFSLCRLVKVILFKVAGCEELKKLSRARLRSARILINAGDWDGSAYLMGYSLETALKAATSKTLHLVDYPENTKNKKIDAMFMTHQFDQLLMISGLSDLFTLSGPPVPSKNWSEFVQEYPGDWVNMRYDPNIFTRFDKDKVERLYNNLYEDPDSILRTLGKRKRW